MFGDWFETIDSSRLKDNLVKFVFNEAKKSFSINPGILSALKAFEINMFSKILPIKYKITSLYY